MKNFVLVGTMVCLMASMSFGLEFSDAQWGTFGDSGWDPGTSHAITDIAGDPGLEVDVTYTGANAGDGWARYIMTNLADASLFNVGTGNTWEFTMQNLSPYYVWVRPYIQGDNGDNSWTEYTYGTNGYLDPQGNGAGSYLGESTTFSITPTSIVSRRLTIEISAPTPAGGWSSNLPDAGGTLKVQITPEPATMALLGLGGLVLSRKRKKA